MVVTDNNTSYIIDASVVLACLLPDEIYTIGANIFLNSYYKHPFRLLAPTLLPFEVINGLVSSIMRKRITYTDGIKAISLFQTIDIELVTMDQKGVFALALSQKLSVYDGSYAWLMSSHDARLITADKKLFNALKRDKRTIWIEDFS